MNLKEKLREMADYSDKHTYEVLVKQIEDVAKNGRYAFYVDCDEVLRDDIEKLKSEGLYIERLEGEGYAYGGCWHISW